MKILIVMPSLASVPFLREMISALDDAGWEVHLAASGFDFDHSRKLAPEAIHHSIDFPRGAHPRSHLQAASALNTLVRSIAPAIVDIHFSAAMLTGAIGRRRNWPVTLATVQGLRFPKQTGLRRLIETRVECWAASRMDQVTVLTADDLEALEGHGVKNASLQTARGFGCRLDVFDPAAVPAAGKELARTEAGIQQGEKVFIFIGRKTQFKGYDLVIRAFIAAQREMPELRLIICGNDDPMHPNKLTDVEQRQVVNHPGISMLGWRQNVRDFLAVSDINVFPSEREGMPVNLMESLAMGVPVITSDSRGCRDIVEDGVTGVVLPDTSEATLSREMLALARDDVRRATLSGNALRSRDQWDRRHFVEERLEQFECIVQRSETLALTH